MEVFSLAFLSVGEREVDSDRSKDREKFCKGSMSQVCLWKELGAGWRKDLSCQC